MRTQYSPIYKAAQPGRRLKLNLAQCIAILTVSVIMLGLLGALLGYGLPITARSADTPTTLITQPERLHPDAASTEAANPSGAASSAKPDAMVTPQAAPTQADAASFPALVQKEDKAR